jgi:hypothetical protein
VSYDWSRGFSAYNPAAMPAAVLLHAAQESEVKARAKAPAAAGRK